VNGIVSEGQIPVGTVRTTVLRSASRSLPNNITKTGTFTHTLNSHFPAGDYTLVVNAKIGGERATLYSVIHVGTK
jgi:hypothetical protein